VLLLWGLGLILPGLLRASSPPSPEREDLAGIVRDNNARLRYLTSQILQIQDQNERILALVQTENSTLNPLLERRLRELQVQLEELKIQVQILGKALIALVAVLILVIILVLVRSRRPPRPGSIRI